MSDRFALVSGTSSGVGLEMAYALLEMNYTVFGLNRRGAHIEHDNYIDLYCDVRLEESVEDAYAQIGDVTDGLDLIVSSAGLMDFGPVTEMSTSDFRDIMDTNVLGAFHLLKHASPFLIEGLSHIIHLSSLASLKGFAGVSAFSASKHALNGLIESTREEWREMGVRFSTLMPGAINTSAWDRVVDADRDNMCDIEDFMYVFKMIVNAPAQLQFPSVQFLHRDGVLM